MSSPSLKLVERVEIEKSLVEGGFPARRNSSFFSFFSLINDSIKKTLNTLATELTECIKLIKTKFASTFGFS